jgi:hypothetical protein
MSSFFLQQRELVEVNHFEHDYSSAVLQIILMTLFLEKIFGYVQSMAGILKQKLVFLF